jgi:hypothetical protein
MRKEEVMKAGGNEEGSNGSSPFYFLDMFPEHRQNSPGS